MKLTDDHKVQIFCAALSATAQYLVVNGLPRTGTITPVETASTLALEAIKKLQTDEWKSTSPSLPTH
jgi:hypothetical protein